MMMRIRLTRRRAPAVPRPWGCQFASASTGSPSLPASIAPRYRSNLKWRRRALVGGSLALLVGLSSPPDDLDSPLRREWLLLRCGWMLGTSFVAYNDMRSDLFGDASEASQESEDARASRRMLWWGAIQRSRPSSDTGASLDAHERLLWIVLDLIVPPSDSGDESQEDRDDLVETLVKRGVLELLVDYVATEKPTDPVLLDKIFQCLERALDAATLIRDEKQSPRLSTVRLGVALDRLMCQQEIPRYGDLVRLAQHLQEFQRRGTDPIAASHTRSLLPPQQIDDEFGASIRGYLRMLSPEMPSTMKAVAMDCLSSMLQAVVNLPECATTHQLSDLFAPACALDLLALPMGNTALQESAAAFTTSLLQASLVSCVPVNEDIYELWMQHVRAWATGDSTTPSLQLVSANCLRVLSGHPRTRHLVRDSPKTMEALFTMARQLHEAQATPPVLSKKKEKKSTQPTEVQLPSLVDQVEQALIQKHLSKAFLNVCTSYKSGGTAILETATADTFHTKRQLPMSRVFHGAQDLMDLPVYGADEYDASTEFGWADILTHWTGSSDREIRRNAIECLVHLVEQESDSAAGITRQQLLLQAWLASMLQHVRNVTGGEEILAIKQVEDIARISDEFTPGNEKMIFSPAVVDAGASALAILAEQHYDELIHFGAVELMSLLATKSPSHKRFDFAAQSARVVANLVAACAKTLEDHQGRSSTKDPSLPSTDVTKASISVQPFSFHHPLWKTFFAEVFDIGQMLETTSSGHKLLEIINTWRDRDDPYQRSQMYRARANLAAYREMARSGTSALPIYAEGVHPIVPHSDIAEDVAALDDPDVDVVFVHGLRGDAFGTWRTDMDDALDARSDVWPDVLLYEDLKHLGIRARILSLGYEAGMVSWSSPWPSLTLQERAKLMLNALYAAHVGDDGQQSGGSRPVVFVTHSMGGILVKKMLLQSKANTEGTTLLGQRRSLAECTKGVVFLAVPHFGSDLARGARSEAVRSLLRTHPAIQDLCASHDRRLENLNDSFAELGIDCLSIAEQKPAPLGFGLSAIVVKPDSANPGIGSFFMLPNADHMTICKAKDSNDPMYQSVLDYVMGHINAAANGQ